MTGLFNYYELAHPNEGVGSGFKYKTVPHVTLKSIANNEPPATETLYDQPFLDNSKARVTGPFTVEAVPAQAVKPLGEIEEQPAAGNGEKLARRTVNTQQSEYAAEKQAQRIYPQRSQWLTDPLNRIEIDVEVQRLSRTNLLRQWIQGGDRA